MFCMLALTNAKLHTWLGGFSDWVALIDEGAANDAHIMNILQGPVALTEEGRAGLAVWISIWIAHSCRP